MGDVDVIEVRHEGDWARVLVEPPGMLAICSSFGNWAFTFSAPSLPFAAFLAGCDATYLKDKLCFQFQGKPSRDQKRNLDAFMKKMWLVIREGLT